MKTSIKALFVTAFVGMPTLVFAEDLPPTCCPVSCKTVEGPVTLGATFVTADFSNTGTALRTTPLAKDAVFGRSPDAKYHICVQFTEFGDEEIKCVLSPSLM